ncbi:MarR family winged helix-turn-helix transcriptional regulator [Streptomyces aurantiacus]|uniref:MarR family winged helix-turn-helix transcriptional regulator n=1 Tax=Streptomyces aurantiacus TaxID=47760 RepID=UPI0027D801A2|nr:MarR family winged helix-turn-helix transcriptional regulator [Streptomyces aurantiacus]
MSASTSENKKPRNETSHHEKPRGEAEDLALETDLGWAIRMVSGAFSRGATESVADLPGKARGYLVLVALAGGEPPSQLALAKEVSLDRTVMTYLLDDLEAHELVTRRPDPRDRRARQVLITDTGRTRLGQVRRSLAAAEARLLTDLDDQDAQQLRTLLSRVAQTAQRELIAPEEENC